MVDYSKKLCCKYAAESDSEKICEDRLTFGEVRDKSLVSRFFLTHSVLRFVVDFFCTDGCATNPQHIEVMEFEHYAHIVRYREVDARCVSKPAKIVGRA